jgi:hypothetical protein
VPFTEDQLPVGGLVADPADLAAQDRVLVAEHQEFGVLWRLAAAQHHQAVEQAAGEQVEDREDHSAMISGREPAKARPDRVIEPNGVRGSPPSSAHSSITSVNIASHLQSASVHCRYPVHGYYYPVQHGRLSSCLVNGKTSGH